MEKRRNHKKWYIILFSLVVLVSLLVYTPWYFEHRVQILRANIEVPEAVERYEALLKAVESGQDEDSTETSGYAFTSDELQASQESMAAYAALKAEFSARFDNSDTWNAIIFDFPDTMTDWTENEWEQVAIFIGENEDYLAKIRELATLGGPFSSFDFEQNYLMNVPHGATVRHFARLLYVNAGLQARSGNWNQVIDELHAITQFSLSMRKEPILISQLVSFSINSMAIHTIENLVPRGTLSPAVSKPILKSVLLHLDREQLAVTMARESTAYTHFFDDIRDGDCEIFPEDLSPSLSWLYSTTPGNILVSLDEASYVELMIPFPDIVRLPYYQAIDRMERLRTEIVELPWTKPLTPRITSGLNNLLDAFAFHESRIDILNLGLSLEAYYDSYGSYPVSLDDINPIVGPMPVDPFTGEAFHYIPNGDTFTLYSVGQDLEDDGGYHDRREGDIVWRGREED